MSIVSHAGQTMDFWILLQSVGEMCIIKKDYINAVWHCAAAGGLETNMICNTILEAVGRTPVIRLFQNDRTGYGRGAGEI